MQLTRTKSLPLRFPGPEQRLTIRGARPEDAETVAGLAELDEAPVPAEPLLLAEVDGELWVAVSLSTAAYVADPFRPSAELTFELLERSRAYRRPHRQTRGAARRWSRLKPAHHGP